MKNFLKRKYSTWLSLSTFVYALTMIFIDYNIKIINPPARYFLIGWLLFWSIVKLILIFNGKKRLAGYALIMMSLGWVVVTWLYFVHPVVNSGGFLALMILGIYFIVMLRGDYSR